MDPLDKGLLSSFLERMFGSRESATGEGREYLLRWEAPWAPWITLSLVILVVAYVALIYFREQSGRGRLLKVVLGLLRLALVGLVLFMLYRYSLHEFRTDLPDVVVVLDISESMSVEDQFEDKTLQAALDERVRAAGWDKTTRLNMAKALLLEDNGDLLARLRRKYNLKFYLVGESARLQSGDAARLADKIRGLSAEEPASRLGKCLRDVLEAQRGRPTAAVIFLTDGIATDGQSLSDVAELARRKSVPLFPVALGNEKTPRDVWLSDLLVDEVAFVGDSLNFDFKVTGSGYRGRQAEIRLRHNGDPLILARTTVTLDADGLPKSGRLTYRPQEKGEFDYIVEVAPLEGESKSDNNSQQQQVSVRNDTIRVLLVQAYPNYEFRYLKTLLRRQLKIGGAEGGESEKAFELTTVQQDADPDHAAQDETAQRVFPVRRDELFSYDVVIFGDVNPSYLSRSVMENLADFVKVRGGGIVFVAGPSYTPLAYRETPLADLFPFDLVSASVPDPNELLKDDFTVRLTQLGLSSPQMQLGDSAPQTLSRWQKLPGLYWLLRTPDMKAAARVLAEHPALTGSDGRNLPVISMQYVGAGKVMFHASDETWRWRKRTEDALFGRYWVQMIRYLSRSKLLGKARSAEVTTDRAVYRLGDPVRIRVRFLDDRAAPAQDDGVTIVLERKGSKNRRIQLRRAGSRGIFEGTVTNLAKGSFHGWVATPTLKGGAPSCSFAVEAPPGEWARLEMDKRDLTAAAKKSEGRYYTLATAGDLIRGLPAGRQVPVEALEPINIWNSHWVLCLFVTLIVTEWLLRKWGGML